MFDKSKIQNSPLFVYTIFKIHPFLLGQNSKFTPFIGSKFEITPFYWVKIQNSKLFIRSIFCKRSSLRSQTFSISQTFWDTLYNTWAIASPLLFLAKQVMGPVSDNWQEVMSKVWQPDSLTIILCLVSWMSRLPCRYHWISGGGRPPTRHWILKESFSNTSKSCREVRKRGVSCWSSSSENLYKKDGRMKSWKSGYPEIQKIHTFSWN